MLRDGLQSALNFMPHNSSVVKPIKTRVLVGHCAAEQGLQVVVAVGAELLDGEVRDDCFELGNGVVEELEAVVESYLLKGVELLELFFDNAGAVGEGGLDLRDGVGDGVGYDLWD